MFDINVLCLKGVNFDPKQVNWGKAMLHLHAFEYQSRSSRYSEMKPVFTFLTPCLMEFMKKQHFTALGDLIQLFNVPYISFTFPNSIWDSET